MKEALAILFLVILLALGWKQSYLSQIENLFGHPSAPLPTPKSAAPAGAHGAPARLVAPPVDDSESRLRRSSMAAPSSMGDSDGRQRTRR